MIKAIAEHRSIRQFINKPIPKDLMEEMLTAATRASTTGGMQLYSIIVSESDQMRERLSPCHFNQPLVRQAGAIVTFCADVNRFSKWCKQRNAEPAYDNFAWFVNAAIDTLLASENFSLEAENQGLGICYLGTTTYTARSIIEILDLPKGVIPVATVAVGYPDSQPPLALRLPVDGVVHYEKYCDYSEKQIDKIFAQTEASEQTERLLEENDLPNLARIFTERRYKKEDNIKFSKEYYDVLREQGFLEF